MQPSTHHSFIAASAVVRADKATRGLEAIPAPNPNQGNRVIGRLADGQKAIVVHRPGGKGGMDFNKILGGKVRALAADGLSPVKEKDKSGKPTGAQKTEGGLPVYSASGFYALSTEEYPALDLSEGYTRLLLQGQMLLSLTQAQLDAKQTLRLESEFELGILEDALSEMLADAHSAVARFDVEVNRKRERGIRRAQEEAQDANEPYAGVAFKPLQADSRDGRPFVLVAVRIGADTLSQCALRHIEQRDNYGKPRPHYLTVRETLARVESGPLWARVVAALTAGEHVEVGLAQGWALRTSVSFRRKVDNVLSGVSNQHYGDAVYIKGALAGWVRGIVAVMHSMHPSFPHADYDTHHYVAAPRQAEIGMDRKAPSGWTAPVTPTYHPGRSLLA